MFHVPFCKNDILLSKFHRQIRPCIHVPDERPLSLFPIQALIRQSAPDSPSGLRIASDATATSPSSASREGEADLGLAPSILIFLGGDPRSEFRADQLIAKSNVAGAKSGTPQLWANVRK